MKHCILPFVSATTALFLVSCDKPANDQNSKLSQLEKKAAGALERQRQLESELAEQKLLTERDAIERERTLIEQDRVAMQDSMEQAKKADKAAMEAELQKRRVGLAERERKISEAQGNLDAKERQLTGLEGKLSQRELNLAGRRPLKALPAIQKDYVSGPTGDFRNFYEPLGAYGSWFNTRNLGYVYQPSVVQDASWRPYTRGRWAFTDQGWTWVSSEPFGWACYHYGRWAQVRGVGWVWVPGSEWAPAWVTWRESPGHVGWAPLPPETLAWRGRAWDSSVESNFGISSSNYSFVSYRNFGNSIQSHCLPPVQNTVIYNTTINITHYQITGNRVFVGGPGYRDVCDRIGRPFPIHYLRSDLNPDFGRGGRHLGSHFRGNELQVIAPCMDANWNHALRPANIDRDLGVVTIDRPRELPADVREEFRDRHAEEIRQAEQVVTDAGGRENFERARLQEFEQNRLKAVEAERAAEAERNLNPIPQPNPDTVPGEIQEPPVAEMPDRPADRPDLEERTDGGDTSPSLPEPPAIPGDDRVPTVEIPTLPDPAPAPELPGQPALPEPALPPGDEPPVVEPPVVEPPAQAPTDPEQPVAPEMPELPAQPEVPITPEQPQQPEPTPPVMPERDEVEQDNGQQQEEQQRQQEQQQEEMRQQQEEQQQQEEMRQQQEEQQRQQEEQQQQEEMRQQQEEQQRQQEQQQEEMRQQQEEQQRQQEEQQQQEEMRQQQEEQQRQQEQQQEEMRQQQEEQQRQQEEQQQQEEMRQQQEEQQQQEEMRQQQEEQQRQQEEQQQQEEMRQQQEEQQRQQEQQQEEMRQQQEEQQRQQQEQQQEEMRRQQEEQQQEQQQ